MPVREAATAHDAGVNREERLGDETRLPEAGFADDRHQFTALVGECTLPGAVDQADLALAAHKRAFVRPLRHLTHRDEAVRGDRLALPLELEGADRLALDGAADELERPLADQNLIRFGRLLQPCGHVHRVAGSEPLLGAGDDLTGIDADSPSDA